MAIARHRSEWRFVWIGDATLNLSEYRAIPNMHFLGRKPYEQIPAYCRGFDVGLIPFQDNELTKAVNPIKLREYLAVGLPVVSTSLPEVRQYERGATLAAKADEFERACAAALSENTPQCRGTRSADMRTETWPAKVERISRAASSGRKASSDANAPALRSTS
jgi:glycosyltransferase involved in cell wall biosynthesis